MVSSVVLGGRTLWLQVRLGFRVWDAGFPPDLDFRVQGLGVEEFIRVLGVGVSGAGSPRVTGRGRTRFLEAMPPLFTNFFLFRFYSQFLF